VTFGLAGAFAAAVAYGVATILQTIGARRQLRADRVDVRLLWRLTGSLPFVLGIILDAAGFGLSLAALRSLPLFVVQAAISSNLAVTALLAAAVLRARLRAVDWAGIAAVTAGLTLLAVSAAQQHPARVELLGRVGLLLGVLLLAALALLGGRHRRGQHATAPWALGVLAGLCYGAASIGARALRRPGSLAGLVTDPASWAIVLAGLLGLLLYATALQRGAVTVVTAAVTTAETLAPAAIGVALLGDHPRRGLVGLAATGFALTVGGALVLARYGEVRPEDGFRDDRAGEPAGEGTAAEG
jgi:drug/metabolite transporter (DMT)-like permease